MPKSDDFPGIDVEYEDLSDFPADAEIHIVADGVDYNVTVSQLFEIIGRQGFPLGFQEALPGEIDEALGGSDDWRSTGDLEGGVPVLDEDNFASNSDEAVPTQQSTKAYVDTGLAAKAATSHSHTIGNVTGLQAALDSKLDADDASVTDARTIADGDYGVFTVSGGVASFDDGTIVNADLASVGQNTIKGRVASGTGAVSDLTAAQVLDLMETAPTEALGDFGSAILAPVTVQIGVVTYADHIARTSFAKPYTPYAIASLVDPASVTYAATVTLNYAAAGNVTTVRPYVNATGNCAILFNNLAGMVGQEIEVTIYNTSGGSITVGPTIGTANGIATKHGTSVTNPGIGTGAGDMLTAVCWVQSATTVVVRRYYAAVA